jgi:hypothetical protein
VRFQCIVVTPGSLRVFTIPIVMLTTVSRLRVLLRSRAQGDRAITAPIFFRH